MKDKRYYAYISLIAMLLLLSVSSLTIPVSAATYTVTVTADSGPGSLRQAITDANANPGLDTITFAIGAPGSQQSIKPVSALPSITSPLFIDGWSQGGGSYNGPPLIELNGGLAGTAAYALRISSGSSTVRGLAINGFPSGTAVILLTAGSNWVYGNHIGTNLAGTTAVSNITGISINADSSNNIIGTNGDGIGDAAEGNLISGNGDWGILFAQAGTTGNIVAGNKIGTNAAGTTAVPNGLNSSSRAGVYLGGTGNRLGTDRNGISDVLEGNLISGNNGRGVALHIQTNPAAAANVIAGNQIGTDSAGLAALPNSGSGIDSFSGPNYNIIIRGNVIAGNSGSGIAVSGLNQSEITGNLIGVGADGSAPLGNGSLTSGGSVYGVFLSGSDNQIGGPAPGDGNTIANQTAGGAFYAHGIAIGSGGVRNAIRGNAIYNNKNLGIDLNNNLVSANDDGDGDSGSNNLQNYPVLSFAQSYNNGETVLDGTLNSQANTTFTLDFYASAVADDSDYGEGEQYLGADQVTTDGSGNATFSVTLSIVTVPAGQFVTATATDPDGNTSEFSLAFGPVSGVQDVPISGLAAQVTPPIFVDVPTVFFGSVSAGSNVTYDWDFGDGNIGSGASVQHTFTSSGTYTATLTASNNSGTVMTGTAVTVLEPANINGVVWYDKDEDGFWGLGESAYLYPGGAVVTATLQNPPTVLTDVRDSQGNYQILTPQPGLYVVEAGRPLWHTTSPNPVTTAMSSDGGVTINFGMNLNPTAGTGRINGRSWTDNNANGFPDPGETPLPALTVTLRQNGSILTTSASDSAGWINLPGLAPGAYWVDVAAPSGYYPALQTRQVTIAAGQVVNAHAPFLAGGTISGQVSGQNSAGIGGVTLTLLPDNVQTTTTASGSYSFSGLSAGARSLQLSLPANFITTDGQTTRSVPVALNSGAVENWSLAQLGQVVVQASQISSGQALPLNNMFFELWQNGSAVRFATTDVTGQAVFTGLAAGAYTVKPFPTAILPGTLVTPAERTAVVTLNSAATATFNFNLARSISLHCLLPGTPPVGFACQYEIRSSSGSLIDSGSLPAANPSTTLWNLNPATLSVRLIPETASWPIHNQTVILNDNIHANVYYPYNPTNLQTISGYAFWDRCVPIGTRANSGACNETGVTSSNDLTVTLFNEAGTIINSTVTAPGIGLSTGAFAFTNLPVGVYRIAISLPTGYTPTTATQFWRTLDGIASPEQFHFGYQLATNQALGGRVFTDNDSNGSYDAAWDDPLPGAAVNLTSPTGQAITSVTTASDGSFTITPINSGEYRLTLSHAGKMITQVASVPANGMIPLVNFPLPPAGSQPRVLLFIDSDHDGEVGANEQRLAGVAIQLYSGSCSGLLGLALQSVNTDAGGLAIFAEPAVGNQSLCARVSAGLPSGAVAASPIGVTVRRDATAPVPLAAQPTGTLRVRPFWDADGDAERDNDEPYVIGGSATVNGVTLAVPAGGASFNLPNGRYDVAFVVPPGYSPGGTLPISVPFNAAVAQTVAIPLRDAGSVSGRIFAPDSFQNFNVEGGSLAAGLTVELLSQSSGLVIAATTSAGNGGFSFANLTPGAYRLRLPAPPPGYIADAEPLLTYQSGMILSGQNLSLVPTGHVSGLVYLDSNGNGQQDGSESGTSQFAVRLMGFGGQEIASAVPNAYGYFLFEGLSANEPYAVQMVLTESNWYVSASPGIFTVGLQPHLLEIGLNNSVPGGTGSGYFYGGQVFVQQGGTQTAVAGARVINFERPCTAVNPVIAAEKITGLEGGYHWWNGAPCTRVVDVPGYAPSTLEIYDDGTEPCGDCVLVNGIYFRQFADISIAPAVPQAMHLTGAMQSAANTAVSWSAFRDDNGNFLRDDGEWSAHVDHYATHWLCGTWASHPSACHPGRCGNAAADCPAPQRINDGAGFYGPGWRRHARCGRSRGERGDNHTFRGG